MTGRDRDPNVILDPFITTAVSKRDKFFFHVWMLTKLFRVELLANKLFGG